MLSAMENPTLPALGKFALVLYSDELLKLDVLLTYGDLY